ncbi:hypothetical protein L7F22_063883 [Adiantum nelumboides]|nr:hypothetical protein [Adiantum nelumboides]
MFHAEADTKEVVFTARIQTSRSPSARLVFLTLRNRFDCVQAVLAQTPEKVSKQMVKWAAGLEAETIVEVQGIVSKVAKPIESATVTSKDAEVKITQIHAVRRLTTLEPLPFYVDDATRSEAEVQASQSTDRPMPNIGLDTRLDYRVLDLRTTTNQAIFRIQHGVCKLFREFLDARDFVEIHTPKLQGAATESGASVFKVSYFKGAAFLAKARSWQSKWPLLPTLDECMRLGQSFGQQKTATLLAI